MVRGIVAHGWVAIVDLADDDVTITLMDPYRKAVAPINVPRLDYEHLNPDPESYLESYQYEGGQEYRTGLNKKLRCISDVIFYKSQVYTMGRRGRNMPYDIKGSNNRSRLPKAKLLTRNSLFENSDIKDVNRVSFLYR
ncbi:unnamed protein product [Prunus armeniaca]|uniref:Uncharacterized protein n=1 Tax=Prunus armeniaca TaxID=36596 RepID=A0A6J5V1G0_PRUAR|nr:unnamed protein product [Prunus armeniaca]